MSRKRMSRKVPKRVEESDERWERRWRELGYDQQEREYYAQPPGGAASPPQSSHALNRYINTGQAGVKLIVRGFGETGVEGPYAPLRSPRPIPRREE